MKRSDAELNELFKDITRLVDGEIKDEARKAILFKLISNDDLLKQEYYTQLHIKQMFKNRKLKLNIPDCVKERIEKRTK